MLTLLYSYTDRDSTFLFPILSSITPLPYHQFINSHVLAVGFGSTAVSAVSLLPRYAGDLGPPLQAESSPAQLLPVMHWLGTS